MINSTEDSGEYGDYLFLHPQEIEILQHYDPQNYQIVSVHETENGEDDVDMSIPCDFGNQPYKYGYFVIQRPFINQL